MKHLIAFILLTNITFATEDYRDNADGSTSYIGRCQLHEDYADELYTVEEIQKSVSDPGIEYVKSLSELKQEIVLFAIGDVGYINGDEISSDLKIPFFDDITIQEIHFKDAKFNEQKIFRVSYGAGGGNGGYLTITLTGKIAINGKTHYLFKKVGHTFDGDLEFCDHFFMKPNHTLTKVPVKK